MTNAIEPLPDCPLTAAFELTRRFCRDYLASYKIPTRFSIVSALPRTPVTGKIRRAVVA